MNALTKPQDALPALAGEAPSMMEMVLRAARDPSVDVSKMERLMQMAKDMRAEEAKTAYFADLAEMQDELPSIQERGEIKIGQGPGQKYALWEDINKAIKPIMKKHGFAISFRTGIAEGKITVTGVLSHRGGHSEETTIHLPSDTSGSKNAVQAVGSSTSYGKRYTASALLNITTGGEDDDGEGEGGFHANPQARAIHGSRTMKPDQEIIDWATDYCARQKTLLDNCTTVAEVQEWAESQTDDLKDLKKHAVAMWSDLRRFKEARIGNINLEGVKA